MLKGTHYCITADNLGAHELIGLRTKVIRSTDAGRKGIEGKVIDETKNVIVVDCNGSEKILPKAECVFEFDLDGEKALLEGKRILYAPEARTKMYWRNVNA